jgi:hypothetical protein
LFCFVCITQIKKLNQTQKNWRKNRAPKKKRKGKTAVKKGARFASRMRGAYQAAARFIRSIKDPKTRETLEKRQESLEKAIKRVDDAVLDLGLFFYPPPPRKEGGFVQRRNYGHLP